MFGLFKRKQQDPVQELRKALGGARLPSFPAVTMQVLDAVRDPDAPTSTIGGLVQQDPALTVKLLKTVNSAASGLQRRCESVPHAVALLGRARVEQLVLAVAVSEALPKLTAPGYSPDRFWRTAARRATVAQSLADVLDPKSKSVSFTAALLQDMAVPLLVQRRGRFYCQLLEQWHGDEGDLDALEQQAFGFTHADIASWLADDWSFPEQLGYALGGHHGSEEPELQAPPPVRLVSVMGEHDEVRLEPLVETAKSLYGARSDEVVRAVNRGLENAAEVAALFAG